MTEHVLLATVIRALVGALAGALLVLFGHGVWTRVHDWWYAARLARARTALYTLGAVEENHEGALLALLALPMRLRIRLLVELARSVNGSGRAFLERLALDLGVVRGAERMMHSRWWWWRLRGTRLLTLLHGNEILVLAALRDTHPAVRAQAAEWASNVSTPAVVNALLAVLDEPSRFCRFAVQDALLRVGRDTVTPLATYLERGTGRGLAAALEVASGLAHPLFMRAAIRLCEEGDADVRARAVELLGAIGGDEGVDAVIRRLEDSAAPVRAAAARALGRLGHWPAAPAIAALLRDRTWDVRRAAGLALRDLGSPGLLLLRRVRTDANLFAADMARQVIDLPARAAARP